MSFYNFINMFVILISEKYLIFILFTLSLLHDCTLVLVENVGTFSRKGLATIALLNSQHKLVY